MVYFSTVEQECHTFKVKACDEAAERGHSGERFCYNTGNPLQARTPLFPLVKAPGNIFRATLNNTTWLLQSNCRMIAVPGLHNLHSNLLFKVVFSCVWLHMLLLKSVSTYWFCLHQMLTWSRITWKYNWNSILIDYLCICTDSKLVQRFKSRHTEPSITVFKLFNMCEYYT